MILLRHEHTHVFAFPKSMVMQVCRPTLINLNRPQASPIPLSSSTITPSNLFLCCITTVSRSPTLLCGKEGGMNECIHYRNVTTDTKVKTSDFKSRFLLLTPDWAAATEDKTGCPYNNRLVTQECECSTMLLFNKRSRRLARLCNQRCGLVFPPRLNKNDLIYFNCFFSSLGWANGRLFG